MSKVTDLGAYFLRGITEDKRAYFERLGDLDELLATLCQKAWQRWPGLQIEQPAFLTYLAERAICDDRQAELPTHSSDLYLAQGCILGDARALQFFESDILCKVDPVLARLGLSASDADEIRQELRTRLLVNTEARLAVLNSYLGTGALTHWVRAVAGRQALMSLRRNKPTAPLDDEAIYEAFSDPVIGQLKSEYRAKFKNALHQSVAQLDTRDRIIMRALAIEGHTVTDIAQTYKVHRVTASRWVSRIRKTLFSQTRALLCQELDITEDEVQSMIRLIESQMEMSLARVLEC